MKNQSQLQTRADPGRSVLLTGGFLLEERGEIGSMRLSKDPPGSLWWIFRALHDGCDPTPPKKMIGNATMPRPTNGKTTQA